MAPKCRLRPLPLELHDPHFDTATMKSFGTPHTDTAIRVLLLGSGELGKEVAIELQRLAVEVIAV
ncbi:MAG: phosphoribosylglycinamide formyltransferase 2, partial [Dokdonella sp.]